MLWLRAFRFSRFLSPILTGRSLSPFGPLFLKRRTRRACLLTLTFPLLYLFVSSWRLAIGLLSFLGRRWTRSRGSRLRTFCLPRLLALLVQAWLLLNRLSSFFIASG